MYMVNKCNIITCTLDITGLHAQDENKLKYQPVAHTVFRSVESFSSFFF